MLSRAIPLQEDGRYDEAVNTIQTWLNDDGHNTPHDCFLFEQIAMIYIKKAYKKPQTKEESVQKAEASLDKALSIYGEKPPEQFDLEFFEIGGVFEILGDLSSRDNCRLYERARQALNRQLPLIEGDTYTAYGRVIPLEPVRKEVRKHLDATNEKYASAGCQTN